MTGTVGDIWKEREKIENYIGTGECPSALKKRCIVKEALFSKVDQACYEWFMQQRCKAAPVYGPILQEKALHFFHQLYPDAERESEYWLVKEVFVKAWNENNHFTK